MDGVCFDFLDYWPSTVLDLIFQHLSGAEILAACSVHKSWNHYLSEESLNCWTNVIVQPKVHNDLEYLVNSKRRYQHLKAVNITSIVPELLSIITKHGRKWKSIMIFRTTFEAKSQMEAILQTSAKTIERLDLNNLICKTTSVEEASQSFNFPHLKKLKISYHYLDDSLPWINGFFATAPLLESLQLSNASDTQMKDLILAGAFLKKLSMSGRFQDKTFFKTLSTKLPSRLEEFEFNDILSSSTEDENLSFFNSFFKSQSMTLKMFSTDALLELAEFETAFKMPHLQRLNIKSFHYNPETITVYLESLKASSVPQANLKIMDVQWLDQNLLELLAIHARGLEELRADKITATNASNVTWFPKLHKFQVFFLNPILKEQIRCKADEDRSRLEKLMLGGIVALEIAIDFSEEDREILESLEF